MQKENHNGSVLGAHPACASCKHQRKKCAEDCVLAPLFPADRTQEFNAVHKLFGVSNVSKLLKSIPRDDDRKRAADSLIWEATCRIKDPVLGPFGEYKRVSEELKFYKNQNLVRQLGASHQGGGGNGMVLKSCPGGGPFGWNGPSKGLGANNIGTLPVGGSYHGIMNSSNYMDIMDDNEGLVMESNRVYNYPRARVSDNKMDIGAMVVSSQGNGNNINQQYYLSGQYNNNINSKTTESNPWEDGP